MTKKGKKLLAKLDQILQKRIPEQLVSQHVFEAPKRVFFSWEADDVFVLTSEDQWYSFEDKPTSGPLLGEYSKYVYLHLLDGFWGLGLLTEEELNHLSKILGDAYDALETDEEENKAKRFLENRGYTILSTPKGKKRCV